MNKIICPKNFKHPKIYLYFNKNNQTICPYCYTIYKINNN